MHKDSWSKNRANWRRSELADKNSGALISDEEGDQGVTGGTFGGLGIIISCVQGDLPPLRPAFQRGITVQSGQGEVFKDTETTLAKDQLENHPHQK